MNKKTILYRILFKSLFYNKQSKISSSKLFIWFVILTLFITLATFLGYSSTPVSYVINGDDVYTDISNKGFLIQTPHTLTNVNNYPLVKFTNHFGSDLCLDFAFGFDTTKAKPVSAELWKEDVSHLVAVNEYGDITKHKDCVGSQGVNYGMINNSYGWCNDAICLENANSSNIDWCYWEHYFDSYKTDTSGIRIFWNETDVIGSHEEYEYHDDFVDVSDYFHKTTALGKTWYYVTNVNFKVGETKTLKPHIIVEYGASGKYDILVKHCSDTIQEAFSSGHYVYLDPWYEAQEGWGNVLKQYHLNEGTGTSADDTGSHNVNATLIGGNDRWVTGRFSYGWNTTGTAPDGTGDIRGTSNITDDHSFSITMWFKPDVEINSTYPNSDDTEQNLFYGTYVADVYTDCRGTDPTSCYSIKFQKNSGSLMCTDYTGTNDVMTTTKKWQKDVWYHVVCVFNTSGGYVYVNGTLENSTIGGTSVGADLRNWVVARFYSPTTDIYGRHFQGVVDEVHIFDYDLSADNVSTLYYGIFINIPPTIEVQNTFINATVGHYFYATAGVYDWNGGSDITATNISSSSGICIQTSNNTVGNYFNVTYNCSGTALTLTNIIIGFTDGSNEYVSTTESSNTHPNQAPMHSKPLLTSSSGTNYTNEDLTCYNQSTYEADNDKVVNIYIWYKDNSPLNNLYLPFQINFNDYSGNGNAVTNFGAVLAGGKIGNGSKFNGAEYVKVTDDNSLDFTDKKTWEIWFKRAVTGLETIFDKTNSNNNLTNYKLYFDNSNHLVFTYSIPGITAADYSWITKTEADFDQGNYGNTDYSVDSVKLLPTKTSGNYTSKISDATVLSSWNNISWTEEIPYVEELPNNKGSDSGADMSGNVLLYHMDNNWNDNCGEGNSGTANGDVTFTTSSKFGSHAGSFDGNGDYISTSTTNFPTGNKDITVEAWFKIDDLNSDNCIVTYGKNTGHNAIQLTHRTSDDKLVFHYWGGYGAITTSLNDNNWHHAVGIHINNTNYLYLDGALAGTTSYTNANIINNFNEIGRVTGYPSYDFDGTIDEVAIYNRTLSATEVLNHYKRGALRLNLSVRSCDDIICDTEGFVDISDSPPQDLSVTGNQYFQYKVDFYTDNTNYTPKLYNVTVGYTRYATGVDETSLSSSTQMTDNNWHYVAVIFDNDTAVDNFNLYLDGGLDNSKTEHTTSEYKDNDLYIGKNYQSTNYFNGTLDEFRIYDSALTPEQINNNFLLGYNKILSQETTRLEEYVCSITPNDYYVNGVTRNSSTLTIRNYIPSPVPASISPADGYASGILPEFNWTESYDAVDGDVVYYIIQIDDNSDFSSIDYTNALNEPRDTNVVLDSTKIDTYYWRVLATDNIGNSSWSSVRNFTYASWSIMFNLTSGEDGSPLDNINISCNYTEFDQAGDTTNPYGPYGFPLGDWRCVFEDTLNELYFDKTQIFTADDDKTVDVVMGITGGLTYQEHTWLEALYNCIVLKDCDLYNLLLQINRTVGNIWENTKPTDESVVTFENVTNKIVDSTHNLTIDYTVNIPIKAGYSLGAYLPVRIGYWFLNEANSSCYNQGDRPTGVSEPYCQPLIIETVGPMGGSISFTVKLQPQLPAGNYNIKRIIDIDPNDVWINYGQETIDTITLTQDIYSYGINLEKTRETIPEQTKATPSTGAVIKEIQNFFSSSQVMAIIGMVIALMALITICLTVYKIKKK